MTNNTITGTDNSILAACKKGIAAWQVAFNHQDAKACAAQYQQNCIMTARPFGVFEGREAIEAFWQGIMDQGFNQVDYTQVTWEAEGESGYILTSQWTMNKAFGVVHRELWVVEADGRARLASDEFEVQGER
ncbi:nuclear transport factor 2 family protein [Shewanella sp. 1_MG-2023]|uniref:YybH family protein n=1 Tax=unclassified Shewanella TaxID=196818 RepID=UPI000C81EA11|nr:MULTISPECIES: nuclear transport factor 2 family protein [unclassified Shewanella]MDO6612028.1 nuclear transport factor 2 family protein [Shewanella sp. 7_MG-2023]MDO6771896.1 nuclear transport factor 2 family protein [Shewanella sp. 2_MG-2023]MDO6794240.1 nuclear transport factor 2 family protein [Shewanella sp. 1_MG-2023]PMG78624.1 isochorismatase [Shewanella sp. 10N.286.51.B7]